MRRHFLLTFGVLLSLLLTYCASPLSPIGGDKDEIPPQLVTEKSTPNFQTNFEKQTIELTFDEWVVLEDVFNQVIISPPLEFKPELKLKKRTLRFDFDEQEVLRPDATYTINFGEAIKDLTEKNPAENLRFVFATGDLIDSLQVNGTIIDALTNDPQEGVLFMLYENTADTVVRTERPFYFARTSKNGQFKIENVKGGTFKTFALEDADLNYLFSQATEKIGFLDSLIVVSDTTPGPIQIRLFQEELPLKLIDDIQDQYGLLKLVFNRQPRNLEIDYIDVNQQIIYDYEKDTLRMWYLVDGTAPWSLYIKQDTFLNDTIQVTPPPKEELLTNSKLKILHGKGGKINPNKAIKLELNHPLASYDTSLFHVYEDTSKVQVNPLIEIDTLTQKNLTLSYPWKEGLDYKLELLPGSLTDIFGISNDSLILDYKADLRKNYGNLILNIKGLKADTSYVIQLFLKEALIREFKTDGDNNFRSELKALTPGVYNLRIITDLNKNGRWDSGNYDLLLQPEPIFLKELEQLRANWDLEAEVTVTEGVIRIPQVEPETPGSERGRN